MKNKYLYFNLDPKKVYVNNTDELEIYQHERLIDLSNILGMSIDFIKNKPSTTKMEKYEQQNYPVYLMRTSGTTNGKFQRYYYPEIPYIQIENYHIHRIMHFNDLKQGNIVMMRPYNYSSISTGMSIASLGNDNQTFYCNYNYLTTKDEWINLFKQIDRLNPILIYMRPAEFIMLNEILAEIGPRNFAVMFSCENLYKSTETLAATYFTKVINKMRCWDGGLSFFTCRCGTWHINDELSYVECIGDALISTDLYNTAHPFIRYWNGDTGTVGFKTCSCGITGKHFTNFIGRNIECLHGNNCKIPGKIIETEIRIPLHTKDRRLLDFRIKQHKDKKITFSTIAELNADTKQMIINIFNTVLQEQTVVRFEVINLYANIKSKQLLVTSELNDLI